MTKAEVLECSKLMLMFSPLALFFGGGKAGAGRGRDRSRAQIKRSVKIEWMILCAKLLIYHQTYIFPGNWSSIPNKFKISNSLHSPTKCYKFKIHLQRQFLLTIPHKSKGSSKACDVYINTLYVTLRQIFLRKDVLEGWKNLNV